MYDIALCEDSPADAAAIQNILDDYEECTDDALRVRCFPDAESLTGCVLCAGYRPDLILTDIHLPGMSGVDAVRRLRDEGFSGGVIFITSSRAYALDAWELHASQYFVKPVKPADIFATLGSILPRRKYLIVRQKKALRKIPFSEILYCETRGKHQAIITRSEEILVRSTSHDMKKKILTPPPQE